jgi:hypothetical protein
MPALERSDPDFGFGVQMNDDLRAMDLDGERDWEQFF